VLFYICLRQTRSGLQLPLLMQRNALANPWRKCVFFNWLRPLVASCGYRLVSHAWLEKWSPRQHHCSTLCDAITNGFSSMLAAALRGMMCDVTIPISSILLVTCDRHSAVAAQLVVLSCAESAQLCLLACVKLLSQRCCI
jgi:hypothetical protein